MLVERFCELLRNVAGISIASAPGDHFRSFGVVMKIHMGALAAMLPLAVAAPASAQYSAPGWTHSESSYYPEGEGFRYRPFRLQLDAGGTITQRSNANLLDNGWNAGLGLTWFPTSHLPLGLRLDGSYSEFKARNPLLDAAAAFYQTEVDRGTVRMWGGDVDLELDFHLGPRTRAYLVAGGGWYRQQTTYRQLQLVHGIFCDWWWCYNGYGFVHPIVARTTSDWTFARNAGVGLEFALSSRASFFIDARYMRLNPVDVRSDFLPIRAGVRF
jgi:opacity protein-like surface antigen